MDFVGTCFDFIIFSSAGVRLCGFDGFSFGLFMKTDHIGFIGLDVF